MTLLYTPFLPLSVALVCMEGSGCAAAYAALRRPKIVRFVRAPLLWMRARDLPIGVQNALASGQNS